MSKAKELLNLIEGVLFGLVPPYDKEDSVDYSNQSPVKYAVEQSLDWDISFDSEQKAQEYLDRVVVSVKKLMQKSKPTGLTTTVELDFYKKNVRDAVAIIKSVKIVKKEV